MYHFCWVPNTNPTPTPCGSQFFLDWYLSLSLRNKDGKAELDFDSDQYDILVSDFAAEEKMVDGVASELPETEYSLRVRATHLPQWAAQFPTVRKHYRA